MPATTTTRLALYKPSSDGSDLVNLVTDLENNWDSLDSKVGVLACTSGTRPSTPFNGQMIRETDTSRTLFWNGAAWIAFLNAAAGETLSASMLIERANTTDSTWRSRVVADTVSRLVIDASGKHSWGPGASTAADTTLYRSAAATLKTDGAFSVVGNASVGGSGAVTGALTVGGALTVTGNINSAANLTMGAETPYTPVFGGTGVSLGNGTIKGSYTLIGKYCVTFVQVVMGSTTTFGSSPWTITLPFTAATGPSGAGANWAYSGAARGHDANWYAGTVSVLTGGTNARIYSNNSSPATEWAAGVPTTWVAHNTAYFDFTLGYMTA